MVIAEPDPETAPEGALARSQAARRRRVLDATLQLAAEGGFDAVQMRDVAAAADVALGTVYRYFASKERLLLEAMAEQQADLRAYLDVHPPREATPAARVVSVLRGANRSLREYPDVTAAMVRSFGTAQIENADIVQRVTEIMTGIITSAIHAPERRAATDARGAGRAHPHAGVAVVAERLGVRRRRPRPGRRGPRRRRRSAARLTLDGRTRSPREWNVFYFRSDAHPPLQLRRPVRARRRQGARPPRARRRPPRGDLPGARRAVDPARAHPRRPRA